MDNESEFSEPDSFNAESLDYRQRDSSGELVAVVDHSGDLNLAHNELDIGYLPQK